MKVGKVLLSCLLTVALLITPFSGVLVFAQDANGPQIEFNIGYLQAVTITTTITTTISAGDAAITDSDVRLEGESIGSGETVSFTPAERNLSNGVYTLVAEATDKNGNTAISSVAFKVVDSVEIEYEASQNGGQGTLTVGDGVSATVYAAEALDFASGYGSTADGEIDLNAVNAFDALSAYQQQYTDDGVTTESATGIPYQTFDIQLNGQADGEIAVNYSGETLDGERVALKAYNATTAAWDTIGTFTGTGSVSAMLDVATYADGDVIHVAAILDYVTNGSDSIMWITDPQHYTKFEDLYSYYDAVYEYAKEQYEDGNIGYVMNTGDLVDDRPTSTLAKTEWEVASNAMAIAEDAGVPNGVVTGNHDVGDYKYPDYVDQDNTTSDYSMFGKYFGSDRYNNTAWYGGSLNNNTSHYDLVTIGNVDFIFLFLGYGLEATDETIEWANNVLQTYSHRTAVIATHDYILNATAAYDPDSRAQLIFDSMVEPNPNVKLVLCGHDDGAQVLQKTTSDGRTVYEILSDYQFVQAEDSDFYDGNEHYIGSVSGCCGDGYLRTMTITGNSLTSVTYSPITDRYAPYGDREYFTVDVDFGEATRTLTTTRFSAAVIGEKIAQGDGTQTFDTDSDWLAVLSEGAVAEEPAMVEESEDENEDGAAAATPDNPYYAHAASAAPTVSKKVDLLAHLGLSDNTTVSAYTPIKPSSSLTIDLEETPYLYVSVEQADTSSFTFSFYSDNTGNRVPWLLFRDANKGGTQMTYGAANWDAYQNHEQYVFGSETICIDMRDYLTDPTCTTWTINSVTLYNYIHENAVINYMFFGSAPSDDSNAVVFEGNQTITAVTYAAIPEAPEAGANIANDYAALQALIVRASGIEKDNYTDESFDALQNALVDAMALAENAENAAVIAAYRPLINAIGALQEVVEEIDPSTLENLYTYDMSISSWKNSDTGSLLTASNSFITATVTQNGGLHLERSDVCTNDWPSIIYTLDDAITLHPNNGKIYVNLDVDANSAWCIYLAVEQGSNSQVLRLNHAIEHFFREDGDGYAGSYHGVYDVTDAFVAAGFDPSSTLTINSTYLYIVPGDVTYDSLAFLTDVADGQVDYTELQAAIDKAQSFDETLYTASSWKRLTTQIAEAQAALNDKTLAQSDINLATLQLTNAIEHLKLLSDVVAEPENSLLPADESDWVPNIDGAMDIYRDENNYTVLQNTNGQWPYADYVLETPVVATVADTQITMDLTVGEKTNLYMLINGTWVSLCSMISANKTNSDGDLTAGTYTVGIPLSSLSAIADEESVTISQLRVYSVGTAANSAVTIRQWSLDPYTAPTPVEDKYADMMPQTEEDIRVERGDGSFTLTDGTLVLNSEDESEYRLNWTPELHYNMIKLNGLHLSVESDVAFKIAINVVSTNGTQNWPTTSDTSLTDFFSVTDDRAAPGSYDITFDLSDLCPKISDKSEVYYAQVILVASGKGTITLSSLEAVKLDNYDWDTSLTYGEAATPDNPYYAHAAQVAPEVEKKVDLLEELNLSTHPTVSQWTALGGSMGLQIDLTETPYLYISVAQADTSSFSFSFFSDSSTKQVPYLVFRDANTPDTLLNTGSSNWDRYQEHEQYVMGSETLCIDMRQFLTDPTCTTWTINGVNFYNYLHEKAVISYMFFGSAPIEDEEEPVLLGDIDGNGKVNIRDAMLLYLRTSGSADFSEADAKVADVNLDGKVNTADAMLLYQAASGLTTLG